LSDTTVANEDEVLPPPQLTDWRIDLYPNPPHQDSPCIQVLFSGEAYNKEKDDITLQLHNLKGQMLTQKILNVSVLQESKLELNLGKYPAGIYIVSIKAKGNTKYSKRFCIL
ncbi:MAG TPA: T9SS type A sorting domain-containing protein, partial [Candidatus Cloacimonadota bacterium]|nr:T9SS type A sorting domain-containing protein [Candidatus Cloacimonadota bacterium]